jgi:hypothetical protein
VSAYKSYRLERFKRGDTFIQAFQITSAHIPANFTGGVFCTLRTSTPEVTEVDDSAALAQTSDTAGGIVWTLTSGVYTGTVTFAAELTRFWPVGTILGEVRGIITPGPARVVPEVPLGSFSFECFGDLKRSA